MKHNTNGPTAVEFFRGVREVGLGTRDGRAFATGLGIGNDADGGFLAPESVSRPILESAFTGGALLAGVRVLRSTGTTMPIPLLDESSRVNGSRWGGVRMYRNRENEAATASRPKFKRVTADTGKKLTGLVYVGEELLSDSPDSEELLIEAFSEEATFCLEREVIHGIGLTECVGFMNSPALITTNKDAGQTANTVTGQNLANMNARFNPRSHSRGSWLVHQTVLSQLPFLTLTNQPVYLPPTDRQTQGLGTLFGKPVYVHEACKTVGTVGDVLLVDSSCYFVVTRGDATMKYSMHVRFVQGEGAYRVTVRADGMPMWTSQLTPFEGSETVSPFVALETRA